MQHSVLSNNTTTGSLTKSRTVWRSAHQHFTTFRSVKDSKFTHFIRPEKYNAENVSMALKQSMQFRTVFLIRIYRNAMHNTANRTSHSVRREHNTANGVNSQSCQYRTYVIKTCVVVKKYSKPRSQYDHQCSLFAQLVALGEYMGTQKSIGITKNNYRIANSHHTLANKYSHRFTLVKFAAVASKWH